MTTLKKQVEALLFSSGRKMHIDEISQICGAKKEEIQAVLNELKEEYNNKDSSLMIFIEGDFWKITVREQYLGIVQSIVTETELNKSLTETLAIIAFKNPAKQADIIKIRNNKAYEHLKELEDMGYITKEKSGRTYKIKLTQKFFDYFDLPPNQINEKFENFKELEKAIEQKEKELEQKLVKKEEVKQQMADQMRKDQEAEKQIDSGAVFDELDEDSQERQDEELAQEEVQENPKNTETEKETKVEQ